jgi:serine phosphatase RsbU (regulator of sigma subunit)
MPDWLLHVVPPLADSFDFVLEGDSVVIGRSSDSTLTLADRSLSRHHCRLTRGAEGWLVEDLGSRSGTLVNGAPIAGPTALAAGDTLQLSTTMLTLLRRGQEPGPRPASADLPSSTVYRDAAELLHRGSTPDPQDPADRDRLLERMRLLNEVHQGLSRYARFDELLDLILDRVFHHLRPEEATIFLRTPRGELERAASRSLAGLEGNFLYSRSLMEEVTEKRLAALVMDAASDERFADAPSILAAGVRSLMAAPLLDPEGCQGMIVLNSRTQVRQFTEADLELLVSLASVAAVRLRNAALAEGAAQHRVLEGELALARRLQLALLPHELPKPAGYELKGFNVPSRTVSGDYYYAYARAEGKECFLMMADVSGKGVAASLLTASLEALAAVPIQDGLSPHEICNLVGPLLLARTPPEKYATAFLGTLEIESGTLRFANAGHNPPLLVRCSRGSVERLEGTGPPLGLIPGARYDGGSVTLEPGDVLVIYTDGITEAENPEGEELGLQRLEELVCRHAGEGLTAVAAALEAGLERFVRGVPFADDRTLLLLRRLPRS